MTRSTFMRHMQSTLSLGLLCASLGAWLAVSEKMEAHDVVRAREFVLVDDRERDRQLELSLESSS